MSLGDSEWVFAHDQLETPELVAVGDGDRWVLVHGLCLYAGEDERDLTPGRRLAEAAASSESEFLDMLDVLGGRHVVLLGETAGFSLYQDAIGMRSTYFSSVADLFASHAHLLNEIFPHQRRTPEQGLNGFMRAWERTPYLGIDALLPNHSLSVPGFKVARFFPRENNRFRSWTSQDRVKELRGLWNRQWQSLSDLNPHLIMSVTGGNDSRTTLALLAEHLHSIKTFTYTTSSSKTTPREASLKLDYEIVEKIKDCISLDHEYIVEPAKRPMLDDKTKFILRKNTIGKHGSWLIPYYLKHFSGSNVIHIRGNAYGVYKLPWLPIDNDDSLEDLKKQYLKLSKVDQPHEPAGSRNNQFLDGAERWEYLDRQFDYHRIELLFWELRLGRWASEIYNETDIVFNSLEPTNVRRMLEIATSFSHPEKRENFFQSELINNTYPLLNFPGKNDSRNLYEQFRAHKETPFLTELDHLHDEESCHALEPVAVLCDESGKNTQIELSNVDILIPAQHFYPGNFVTRAFIPVEATGDLTFTVQNSYAHPNARGTWAFEVLVEGVPIFRWDGTQRHRPVHVAINNLQETSRVSLRLVPLRDRRHKQSWERASQTLIETPVFQKGPRQGSVTVFADILGEELL